MLSPFLRVILLIVLVALVVWRLKSRWTAASNYVEGEAAEKRVWREQFEKFKEYPRYKSFKKQLDAKYKTTYDVPTDEETYRITFVGLFDDKWGYSGFDAPAPKMLLAILKGKGKEIQYYIDLETQTVYENEVGFFGGSVAPSWAQK